GVLLFLLLCNIRLASFLIFFFLLLRPPPGSPLFPYTTLFRSSAILRARMGTLTTADRAALLAARLDRLPVTRSIWRLVVLLSFGGAFEFYDLILTAYASPGLVRSGIFHVGARGLFGLSDQATFASAT